MFQRTRPIEINCDAPPYAIVKACQLFGVQAPQDVGWCRVSHAPTGTAGRRLRLFDVRAWKQFLGMDAPEGPACVCGSERPVVERYTFTYSTGGKAHYSIGQCGRCRTIFWEEG
jgi:hypothetical protein